MIQSLARALDILETLKTPNAEFSIAELSKKLSLPSSTIHRILQTLCKYQYVVRDERSHTYKLGPALIPLGIVVRYNLKIQNSVTSILQNLSHETNEDAYYIIASAYKGIILERAESNTPLKVVDRFGFERYLHSGANRRAILAFQTKEFIKDYIKHVLNKTDIDTAMEPKQLMEELAKIRAEGVALSYGEYIKDTVGIGCPVFDHKGEVKSSMGIIVPTSRMKDPEHLSELIRIVKNHANEFSISMGYSPETCHLS